MFIGHYGLAMAAKRLAPGKSLGWNFIAAQLLDILWAPAVLLGIEHVRIVPGVMPASSLDFYDYPWTHGLAMAAVWSWFFYRVTKSRLLGMLVFSHWVLDYFVHGPDLPLYRGGPKVGLGLWNFRAGTVVVESALVIAGLAIYLNCTRAKNGLGRFGMMVFTLLLIVIEIGNVYGPAPPSVKSMAISGEIAYLAFAGIAAWLDRLRESAP
jgi:hypothetical protein